MPFQCRRCERLNDGLSRKCSGCGDKLRHAIEVPEEMPNAESAVRVHQPSRADSASGDPSTAQEATCASDDFSDPLAATSSPSGFTDFGSDSLGVQGIEDAVCNDAGPSAMCLVVTLPGGRVMPVAGELILGREVRGADPATTLALAGFPGVSRVHAWVGVERDAVVIMDLASRNGTWIAGQRLPPGQVSRHPASRLPITLGLGSRLSISLAWETRS